MRLERSYYFARERFDHCLDTCCHALCCGIYRCLKVTFILAPFAFALAVSVAVIA